MGQKEIGPKKNPTNNTLNMKQKKLKIEQHELDLK